MRFHYKFKPATNTEELGKRVVEEMNTLAVLTRFCGNESSVFEGFRAESPLEFEVSGIAQAGFSELVNVSGSKHLSIPRPFRDLSILYIELGDMPGGGPGPDLVARSSARKRGAALRPRPYVRIPGLQIDVHIYLDPTCVDPRAARSGWSCFRPSAQSSLLDQRDDAARLFDTSSLWRSAGELLGASVRDYSACPACTYMLPGQADDKPVLAGDGETW